MDKTVRAIGYAMINAATDTGAETYDKIKWLTSEDEGCRSFKADPKGELNEIYADGVAVRSYLPNSGYDITLTTIDALDDVKNDWYGVEKRGTTGLLETNKKSKLNRFVLLEVREDEYGKFKTTVYYNCNIAKKLSDESKTDEGGNFDPIFPEHSIVARPRVSDGVVRYSDVYTSLTDAKMSTVPEPAETQTTQE